MSNSKEKEKYLIGFRGRLPTLKQSTVGPIQKKMGALDGLDNPLVGSASLCTLPLNFIEIFGVRWLMKKLPIRIEKKSSD